MLCVFFRFVNQLIRKYFKNNYKIICLYRIICLHLHRYLNVKQFNFKYMKTIELNVEQTWLVISKRNYLNTKERKELGLIGFTPLAHGFMVEKETTKAVLLTADFRSEKRNSGGDFYYRELKCWLPKDYVIEIIGNFSEIDTETGEETIEKSKIYAVANWLYSKNKSELC